MQNPDFLIMLSCVKLVSKEFLSTCKMWSFYSTMGIKYSHDSLLLTHLIHMILMVPKDFGVSSKIQVLDLPRYAPGLACENFQTPSYSRRMNTTCQKTMQDVCYLYLFLFTHSDLVKAIDLTGIVIPITIYAWNIDC